MTDNPYDPFAEGELHEQYARAVDEPTADEAYLADLDDEQAAKAAAEAAAERHARAVTEVAERMRARAEAEQLVAAAARPAMPALERLDVLLSRPFPPVRYLVDRLWPVGGRIMLSAQAKTGKTTMRDNLIRCLADGRAFLDRFDVGDVPGTIGVIDTELPEHNMARWLGDQQIVATDRVFTVALRGQVTSFDLLDEGRRREWSVALRRASCAVLIIDCLGPILAANGLDEVKGLDVGRWLNALETMTAEAGISEVLIIHHMGHVGERSRGASRLRDWPDAEWRLLRARDLENGDEEDGPPDLERYFAATGRDVDESEAQLRYDPIDRHLSLSEGAKVNRRIAKAKRDVPAVVAYVREHPGLSGRNLEAGLIDTGLGRNRARSAIRAAVRQEALHTHPGPHASQSHYVQEGCPECAIGADGAQDPNDPQPALWE